MIRVTTKRLHLTFRKQTNTTLELSHLHNITDQWFTPTQYKIHLSFFTQKYKVALNR